MGNHNLSVILLIFLAVSLIIFIILGLNNQLTMTYYQVVDSKVEEDFEVLLITDLHSNRFGEDQQEILSKIEEASPDIVLLSGDIIDDRLPMEVGFQTVKHIAKSYPTYYVTGNHEIASKQVEFIEKKLSSFGIKLLAGKRDEMIVNGQTISLMGLDDPNVYADYWQQIEDLEHYDSEQLTFLLAHRPERIKDYQRLDVDYVFSGHAHGGQWRIPYILENGLMAPGQGLFPKYTQGIYDLKRFKLIVSRGLSREIPNVPRFYNPPELVVIEFKKS